MPVYKGWQAKILVDGTEVGRAESCTIDISAGTEAYWEMGQATPVDVVAGNVEITGTITKAWVDNQLLNLIKDAPVLSEFDLVCSIVNTPRSITVYKCKPEASALDIPQDDFLTYDFDFIGTSFAIT